MQKKTFCCICGSTEHVDVSICENCKNKEKENQQQTRESQKKTVKKQQIPTVCPSCGRVKVHNHWKHIDVEGIPRYRYCNDCSQIKGNRIHAVVQLRFPEEIKEEEIKKIELCLEPVPPTKYAVEEKKNGFDFNFINTDLALSFSKRLQKKFIAKLITSRKQVTQDKHTGKQVYKTIISVRTNEFQQGTLVYYKDSPWRIDKISDKSISLTNITKKERKTVSDKEYSLLKKVQVQEIQQGIITAHNKETLYVMLDESYETVEIPNTIYKAKNGMRLTLYNKYYFVSLQTNNEVKDSAK